MSQNAGDFAVGSTVRMRFNTRKADGTPITLGGTPAVSVYKQGSTTESTAGVTLVTDYDGRTGYHSLTIDTSADGTFYATGNDFFAVITTGTVDSVSVVGVEVGRFSLANRNTVVSSVTGDVGGKVLGGGSGTITGTGVRADNRDGDAIPTAAQNAAAIDTATLATDIAAELQGSGVSYTVVSPIAQDGDSMTIVPGDDYADADSRAIGVTITGTQPAYTGATPRLRMSTVSYDAVTGEDTTTVVTVTGTVVTATGATRVVKFEPTAADTSQLAAGVGTWEVEVTLTSGNVLTPIVDKELIVKPQLG